MNNLTDLREQLQEDLMTYFDGLEIPNPCLNDLCQIIVDRVTELQDNQELYPDGAITQGDKKLIENTTSFVSKTRNL